MPRLKGIYRYWWCSNQRLFYRAAEVIKGARAGTHPDAGPQGRGVLDRVLSRHRRSSDGRRRPAGSLRPGRRGGDPARAHGLEAGAVAGARSHPLPALGADVPRDRRGAGPALARARRVRASGSPTRVLGARGADPHPGQRRARPGARPMPCCTRSSTGCAGTRSPPSAGWRTRWPSCTRRAMPWTGRRSSARRARSGLVLRLGLGLDYLKRRMDAPIPDRVIERLRAAPERDRTDGVSRAGARRRGAQADYAATRSRCSPSST